MAAFIAPIIGAVAKKLFDGKSGGGGGGGSATPAAQAQPVQTPQPPMIGVSSPSLQADKAANMQRMQTKYGYPGV